MKLKPVKARTSAVGGVVSGVRWRYDPDLHDEGMEVSPDVGRILVASGHWTEVQSKPKKAAPKATYNPDDDPLLKRMVEDKQVDDRLSE